MDALVRRFLKGPGKTGGQIVGLGAGSDTRFWRLMVSRQKEGGRRATTVTLRRRDDATKH